MQYSPKLKVAMEEIKDVLKKHDIAGLIILHTPGYSEYLYELRPSYSCVLINGDELRVRARLKEDFNGDKEAKRKMISETSNMLILLSEVGMRQSYNLSKISEKVDKIVDAEHTDLGHSSQTEQNN